MVENKGQTKTNYNTIFETVDVGKRRTKIVCTVGAVSDDTDSLVKMIDSGMDVMCCNFSSGDHASHANAFNNLKAALKQREDKVCATMMITKGPEIRTGPLADSKRVALVAGQTLEIHSDMSLEGNDMSVACSYKAVAESV
jgi:pyruvate kinase